MEINEKKRYIFLVFSSVLEHEEKKYIYVYVFLGVSSSRKKKYLCEKKTVGLLPNSNYIVKRKFLYCKKGIVL